MPPRKVSLKKRLRVPAAAAIAWAVGCGDGSRVTEPAPQSNRAPRAEGTIPAMTVSVGESTSVDVSPYFSDPDGDALAYAT